MYYHQDHLGSTRLTTNANGTTRGTLTYTAYGETKTNTNHWFLEQPLLTYAGEQHDPETGLIYLRARYYDPATGQFMSEDPAAPVTADPYGYSLENPANYVDPTGLWPSWEDVRRTAGDFDRVWDATGGRAVARAEAARQQVADIDLGPIGWGSGAAGTINIVVGYNKVGSGGIIITTGAAATPLTGGVSGAAAYAVGGYQLATGGARIVKGSRQLAQSTSCEDEHDQRLGSNLTVFVDEMTPNLSSIGDFLASLP